MRFLTDGQMVSALGVDRESSRGEWCPTCRKRLIVAGPGEIYIRTPSCG
jgi:hypothetical protein